MQSHTHRKEIVRNQKSFCAGFIHYLLILFNSCSCVIPDFYSLYFCLTRQDLHQALTMKRHMSTFGAICLQPSLPLSSWWRCAVITRPPSSSSLIIGRCRWKGVGWVGGRGSDDVAMTMSYRRVLWMARTRSGMGASRRPDQRAEVCTS